MRDATAAAHRRTEGAFGFAQIQDGTLTRAIYATLLRRLRALYAPAERAILEFIERAGARYDYQVKHAALVADLAALETPAGVGVYPLSTSDPEHGVALIYVLEGATLGGQIITARVHAQLGDLGRAATRFFDPHGADCGPRWQSCRRFLDAVVHDHALDEALVLRRATEVFTWYGACLDDEP